MVVVASILLARMVARPKVITIEKEIAYEKKHGLWKNYDELPKEEFFIKSYDGYELGTIYVPAAEPSDKYVIISHGYGGCRLGNVKYMHMFRDLGYNCVMYDDRGHGDNAKAYTTMGVRESKDLMAVIAYVYERFGDDILLGLHGESMGSGLTTNALQYGLNVRFIVSDCGYNDLQKLLCGLIKTLHLPTFFAHTASVATKLIYGYYYHDVKPINYIRENEIPICFIHGEADDFIPCTHAKEMHEANKGYSELHLFEGAGHAFSIVSDEDRYRKIVKEFLEKVL